MIDEIKEGYYKYIATHNNQPKRLFITRTAFSKLNKELNEKFPDHKLTKKNIALTEFFNMGITIVKVAKIKPHKFLVSEI